MSRKSDILYRFVVRAEERSFGGYSFGIYERIVWARSKKEAPAAYRHQGKITVLRVRQVGGKMMSNEEQYERSDG